MGKALVIKGADFSRNYVERITFEEKVPCTGLTLNKSTVSLPNTISTEILVATVTPSNTTDAVIWTSSNTDIVSVSENGVISAIGIGTATITAQCGDFSATCAVTCGGNVDVSDSGYVASSGAFLYTQAVNNYYTLSDTVATNGFTVGQSAGTYHATQQESADGWIYPLIVPKGATTLHVRCMDQYWGIERLGYLQSDALSSKAGTALKVRGIVGGRDNLGWGDKTYNGTACYGNDVTLITDVTYDSLILGFKQMGSTDITPQVIPNTHIWFTAE